MAKPRTKLPVSNPVPKDCPWKLITGVLGNGRCTRIGCQVFVPNAPLAADRRKEVIEALLKVKVSQTITGEDGKATTREIPLVEDPSQLVVLCSQADIDSWNGSSTIRQGYRQGAVRPFTITNAHNGELVSLKDEIMHPVCKGDELTIALEGISA